MHFDVSTFNIDQTTTHTQGHVHTCCVQVHTVPTVLRFAPLFSELTHADTSYSLKPNIATRHLYFPRSSDSGKTLAAHCKGWHTGLLACHWSVPTGIPATTRLAPQIVAANGSPLALHFVVPTGLVVATRPKLRAVASYLAGLHQAFPSHTK